MEFDGLSLYIAAEIKTINITHICPAATEKAMETSIKDVLSAMNRGIITEDDLIGSVIINVSAGKGRVTKIIEGVFHIYFGGIDKLSRKVKSEAILDTRKWKNIQISDEIYSRMKDGSENL